MRLRDPLELCIVSWYRDFAVGLLYVICGGVCSSCYHLVIPNPTQISGVERSKEFAVSGGITYGGILAAQADYAVTDHFALHSAASGLIGSPSSASYSTGNNFEIGGSYFISSLPGTFDIGVGVGYGSTNIRDTGSDPLLREGLAGDLFTFDLKYWKVFLQGSWLAHSGDNELGFVLRSAFQDCFRYTAFRRTDPRAVSGNRQVTLDQTPKIALSFGGSIIGKYYLGKLVESRCFLLVEAGALRFFPSTAGLEGTPILLGGIQLVF